MVRLSCHHLTCVRPYPDMYLGILARRLLRRGRTGPGQGIVGRLKVAEDYQRLYINNRDKITFIANEDNKQNEALQQIRQIIFK